LRSPVIIKLCSGLSTTLRAVHDETDIGGALAGDVDDLAPLRTANGSFQCMPGPVERL
jgi:hypothetical protein